MPEYDNDHLCGLRAALLDHPIYTHVAKRTCIAGAIDGLRSDCVSLTTRGVTLLNYVLCRRGQQTPGAPKTVRRPSSAQRLRSLDLGS